MNTVEKGDKLESKIFTLFEREIGHGRFFANPSIIAKSFLKRVITQEIEKKILFSMSQLKSTYLGRLLIRS